VALYYLETSALVKLYVREPGTERMLRLASRAANHHLAVLALAQVELRSAIRRREREGDIDRALGTRLIDRFERHIQGRFIRQLVTDSVIEQALDLIDRHPLRAYDAIQLAGGLVLRSTSAGESPIFVCADRQLIAAAEAVGLAALDPTVG
jgi:predicted nucleic acid-binding protein